MPALVEIEHDARNFPQIFRRRADAIKVDPLPEHVVAMMWDGANLRSLRDGLAYHLALSMFDEQFAAGDYVVAAVGVEITLGALVLYDGWAFEELYSIARTPGGLPYSISGLD
jgi:hypothetical protein